MMMNIRIRYVICISKTPHILLSFKVITRRCKKCIYCLDSKLISLLQHQIAVYAGTKRADVSLSNLRQTAKKELLRRLWMKNE